MIIIKSVGGLGNQLFQYALYKRFRAMGKEAKIDFSQLYKDGIQNELKIFDDKIAQPTEEEIALIGDCNQSIVSKVRRKIGIRKKTHIIEKASYTYDPDILDLDNVYLFGFWQTEKYFLPIREELLRDIKFPEIKEEHNIQYAREIANCECAVSLHVRRGDYLIHKFRRQYGGICTDTYYMEAINYFKEMNPNVHFFVFTNDEEWVKARFCDVEMTVVVGNSGVLSYRDLQLMSMCKHNIIANSSFSWWGAWLNTNAEKQVIMPPMWNRKKPSPDIWVPEWKRLNTPIEEL